MDRTTFCQILNSHLIAIQTAFNELIETDEETRLANDEQKKLEGEDTPIHVYLTVFPDGYNALSLSLSSIESDHNKYKKLFEISKTQIHDLRINTEIREQ